MEDIRKYQEHEVKVLDVNVEELCKKLEEIGAKKVYEGVRTIIALDTKDNHYLNNEDKLIRFTQEDKAKITMHVGQSTPETKAAIKFKTTNSEEAMSFLLQLGLEPKTRVEAPRVSYELGKVSFDIDKFPAIPAFLEIDKEYLEEEGYTLESLLAKLGLENNKVVVKGTEDIHEMYGVNYFEAYKANPEVTK